MLGLIIKDIVKSNQITESTLMTIEITEALISGYNNEEVTKKEITKVMTKFSKQDLSYVVSACAWLYSNLRDVENYTEISAKLITDNVNQAKALSSAIFLARMGASKEYIKSYITETYDMSLTKEFSMFFESKSFEDTLEYDNASIVIAEAYYKVNYEKYNYLDEKLIKFLNHYCETLSKIKYEKTSMMNKILEHKPYFDKKEIVRWLPTNNRKTPEFFADYGNEVNDLIKLVNHPYFIDFKYTDTIRRLKIYSFKESIATANMLGIRAMLTSIIRRERFGVGTISRAIADGLISELLERYMQIVNDKNI
ncbi:DUF6508 domain-containing protein [Streptobacillus moniliformis]|uniref:DUF6508 domain-containing protein n=1 Tax=Streptobacillus moniliformis TaxID=34105 RepID=UPI0007E46332|nr:DUF6508 domain-containing protein [Streptobacillus moniliformis]